MSPASHRIRHALKKRVLARCIGVTLLAVFNLGLAGGEINELSTTFSIHEHAATTGSQMNRTQLAEWTHGWSHVRTFFAGGAHYVLLFKNQQAKARIYRLRSNGTLGSLVGNYTLQKDITNVQIIHREGKNPRLLLHKRINGEVIVRRINNTGELGTQLSRGVHEDLKYKDSVQPYQTATGDLYLFSLSRWYGGVAIHPLKDSGALEDEQVASHKNNGWKNGWSSAVVYRHAEKNYLIAYKMMSNPSGVGGGKVVVKRVMDDGTLQNGVHQSPGDGTWTQGFSQFKVIRDNATNDTLLLMYKIHNGRYKVLELNENGVGATLARGNLGVGWTDIDPYRRNGRLFLLKLNEDNRLPFDYKMVKAFEASLQGGYEQNQLRGGGYQVGITQSGRIVYLRATGLAKRSTGKKLKTYHRSGIASVSKLFTSFTTIKMIDNGVVDLDDRLLDHFYQLPAGWSSEDYPFLDQGTRVRESGKDVRISELLSHTGQWMSGGTGGALAAGRSSGQCNSQSLTDTSWSGPPMRCNRKYQNANTGLLGFMLYNLFDLQPEENTQIAAYTEKLADMWMRDAHIGAFCGGYDNVAHYKECTGSGSQCINGYKEFIRTTPGSCLSGSLAASTEDLLQFLSVQRYGRSLSREAHNLIYQTSSKDAKNEKAPYHWGQTLLDGEGWMRSKSGGGKGVSAYVAHMPRGVSIAIISNTKPQSTNGPKTPTSPNAVKTAWTDATGIRISDAQDD